MATTAAPKAKCRARVQQGTYSYAARNADRQCENPAKANGFCHLHQPYTVTDLADSNMQAALADLRASLRKD